MPSIKGDMDIEEEAYSYSFFPREQTDGAYTC